MPANVEPIRPFKDSNIVIDPIKYQFLEDQQVFKVSVFQGRIIKNLTEHCGQKGILHAICSLWFKMIDAFIRLYLAKNEEKYKDYMKCRASAAQMGMVKYSGEEKLCAEISHEIKDTKALISKQKEEIKKTASKSLVAEQRELEEKLKTLINKLKKEEIEKSYKEKETSKRDYCIAEMKKGSQWNSNKLLLEKLEQMNNADVAEKDILNLLEIYNHPELQKSFAEHKDVREALQTVTKAVTDLVSEQQAEAEAFEAEKIKKLIDELKKRRKYCEENHDDTSFLLFLQEVKKIKNANQDPFILFLQETRKQHLVQENGKWVLNVKAEDKPRVASEIYAELLKKNVSYFDKFEALNAEINQIQDRDLDKIKAAIDRFIGTNNHQQQAVKDETNNSNSSKPEIVAPAQNNANNQTVRAEEASKNPPQPNLEKPATPNQPQLSQEQKQPVASANPQPNATDAKLEPNKENDNAKPDEKPAENNGEQKEGSGNLFRSFINRFLNKEQKPEPIVAETNLITTPAPVTTSNPVTTATSETLPNPIELPKPEEQKVEPEKSKEQENVNEVKKEPLTDDDKKKLKTLLSKLKLTDQQFNALEIYINSLDDKNKEIQFLEKFKEWALGTWNPLKFTAALGPEKFKVLILHWMESENDFIQSISKVDINLLEKKQIELTDIRKSIDKAVWSKEEIIILTPKNQILDKKLQILEAKINELKGNVKKDN